MHPGYLKNLRIKSIYFHTIFAQFCMAGTTTVSGSRTSAYTFDRAMVRRLAQGKTTEAKL